MKITNPAAAALRLHATAAANLPTSSSSTTVLPAPTGASIHSSPANDSSPSEVNAPADNYQGSCEFLTGDGQVLLALCYADSGGYEQATSLDLNNCLQNANGILEYPGFVTSCPPQR